MKNALIGLLIIISHISFAENEVKELPPLDPAYMAPHNMILFSHGPGIYAYHLSSYEKPHNVQILYKLDNDSMAVLQTVRDSDYITVKLQPFNLQRLMRGEAFAVQADLYEGHFKRGGSLVYSDITLAFDKQLYVRTFEDIKPSSKSQEYDVVSIRGTYKFYIHKIQESPSFDHILGVDLEAGCMSKFRTTEAVPKEAELQYKFIHCGTMKPLYFETEDFKVVEKSVW